MYNDVPLFQPNVHIGLSGLNRPYARL